MARSHGPLPLPLSSSQLPSQLGKEPTGSKGRRSNGDGQEGKPRKKRSEAKVCHIFIYECSHILCPTEKRKINTFLNIQNKQMHSCFHAEVRSFIYKEMH